MKRILPVLALWLSTSSIAQADLVAARCKKSTTSSVSVLEQGNRCRGFTRDNVLVLFDRMVSGTVLSSKDGRSVVVIEDYLPAVVENKQVVAQIGRETIVNPTVLRIYRDSEIVAVYDIHQLVKDVTKVRQTESHVDWVGGISSLDGKSFTLTIRGGRTLTFETVTGKLTSEQG